MDHELYMAMGTRNRNSYVPSPIYVSEWDDEEGKYFSRLISEVYSLYYERGEERDWWRAFDLQLEDVAHYYGLNLENFYEAHWAELRLLGYKVITGTEGFFAGNQWNIPRLTYEQVNEFAIEAQLGHPDAIELLCIYCSRMVRKTVYTFKWAFNGPFTMMDLYQTGMIGILRAIPKWNEDAGVDFVGYARKWVYGEIQNIISENRHLIKLPAVWEKLRAKLPHYRAELEAELGEPATTEELAFWMFQYGMTAKLIPAPQIMFLETFSISSTNEIVSDEEENDIEAQELIEGYERDPANIVANQELANILLDSLEEEEREIVENAREGMGKLTFKEIAQQVLEPNPDTGKPVTPETVRNRFLKALEKMKICAINNGVDRELVLDRLFE